MQSRLSRFLAATTIAGAIVLSAGVAAAQIPTPKEVLGFDIGDDFQLATYGESIEYFERLAQASEHMRLIEVGKTTQGRTFRIAIISSPANLSDLEAHRQVAMKLASGRGIDDEALQQIARKGRAIVHIDGGMHSDEVANAQHSVQLAYELVSRRDEEPIRTILDRVILILWPTLNPDGQDMIVNWYRQNVGTPYEIAPMPALYQEYVGHDNNRDAYMLNMIESRVIAATMRHYEPQIMYCQHQTSPFPTRIWLPPFSEPIGRRVHPLMTRTVNTIGMLMAQALEQRGQVGAMHKGGDYDVWYPGYADYLPNLRNCSAFFTETALFEYATPHFYTVDDFPERYRDLRAQSLYPSPWPGGWWRLRDAVSYMVTASIATLEYAAKYKDDVLKNRYIAARDTIARYEQDPPYAYIIPRDQRDPAAPVELLRRLAFHGVSVRQLSRSVTYQGESFAVGDFVIRMDQENAELVRQLFEVQHYPDLREDPKADFVRPYDVTGWTLPLQMGVRVIEGREPLSDATLAAMASIEAVPINFSSEEDWYAAKAAFDSPGGMGFDRDPLARSILPLPIDLSDRESGTVASGQNNVYRAIWETFAQGGQVRSVGSTGFRLSELSTAFERTLMQRLYLKADSREGVTKEIKKPRIGIYRPWSASMDEGWTRWVLDRYGIEYRSLRNADVRSGELHDRYDILLLADMRPRRIRDGFDHGEVPPRYEGGLGRDGTRAIQEFVRAGGTLICLNSSSRFAIDALGLPVEDVVRGKDDFYGSGVLLEVEVDPTHPVMAGMPSRPAVMFDRSPVFTTTEGFKGHVLAKYATTGSPLLSGELQGERHLAGYAAALDVHHGEGRVLLIGFRPQWRGQTFGTFPVLFNALLFHGTFAKDASGGDGFWEAPEATSKQGNGDR